MILRLNCNVKNLIQILLYRSGFWKKKEKETCTLTYIISELLVYLM